MPTPRHPELVAHLRQQYAPAELAQLEQWLEDHRTLRIEALDNGLYRALGAPTSLGAATGYQYTWLRDTVHVAECLRASGGPPAHAVRTARTLLAWLEHERPRFEACIRGEADLGDPMQRPHVRFDGHALATLSEPWLHAQNDALGITVWYCARLAAEGALALAPSELDTLVRCAHYFEAIEYEHDRDSGHWEELQKVQASSVGAVVAGLTALTALAASHPPLRSELPLLQALIQRGRATLRRLLPAESRGEADPRANRPVDAALLFLIEPLQVVEGPLAVHILENVRLTLEGPHGIRRYLGDSYWMAGRPARPVEGQPVVADVELLAERDARFVPGSEAQWCLFDPVISIACARFAKRTGDARWRTAQLRHLHRSLAQITGPECSLGEALCPEAYYRTALDERAPWEANDNTPLAWTQAMLQLALHQLKG